MARQPFLPTYTDAPMQIGSTLIEELPKLAQLIGRIAINWSGVDVQLSVTLGSLLGVENAAAVAVFASLRNHRAQRDAIRAAADQTLAGEKRELLEILLTNHEELDKQRNAYVHGVWGRCDATPDGIVWSSAQAHANMLVADYHMSEVGKLTAESRVQNMTKDLFVVRYSDLENLNSSIRDLERAIMFFHGYIRYEGKIQGDNALRGLLKSPVIRAGKAKKEEAPATE